MSRNYIRFRPPSDIGVTGIGGPLPLQPNPAAKTTNSRPFLPDRYPRQSRDSVKQGRFPLQLKPPCPKGKGVFMQLRQVSTVSPRLGDGRTAARSVLHGKAVTFGRAARNFSGCDTSRVRAHRPKRCAGSDSPRRCFCLRAARGSATKRRRDRSAEYRAHRGIHA